MPHMHEGHRSRVKQRALAEGLMSFQAHEVLELLLFYTIPQRDVNPLAHLLIERFGSVSGVLGAPIDQLLSVPGVGRRTADWLHFLPRMLGHYTSLKLSDRPVLDRLTSVTRYCEEMFGEEGEEEMWSFSLNIAGHLLGSARIAQGRAQINRLTIKQIADPTLRYRAQTVVLVYRRPPETAHFSGTDMSVIEKVNQLFLSLGIQLMDGIILCNRRVISMRKSGLLRLESAGSLSEEPIRPISLKWLEE